MSLLGKSRSAEMPTMINVPEGFSIPPKTQWGFTPSLQSGIIQDGIVGNILTGTALSPHITMHHGGDGAQLSVQRTNDYGAGLVFDFANFTSGYFSLAFELPLEGVLGLRGQDLLRFVLQTKANAPFQAFARLNLCHGPNTEQVVRMIDIGEGESFAEFDIFYTEFDQKRATSGWIDLIINDPASKRITLEQAVILRRARASL